MKFSFRALLLVYLTFSLPAWAQRSLVNVEVQADQIVAQSKEKEFASNEKHIAWIAAYHAYINRSNRNKEHIFYLLGEAGAAVSMDTEQGKLYKKYMLKRIGIAK